MTYSLARHPGRNAGREAVARLREYEEEVRLELLLGSRRERDGFWGHVPGRTATAHFWETVDREVIPGRTEPRFESVCDRWVLGRYGSGSKPRRISNHDLLAASKRKFCGACAFFVEVDGL